MRTIGLVGLGMATAVVGFFAESEHAAVAYQDALKTVQVNAALTADQTNTMGHAIMAAAIGTTSSATDMAQALAPVAGELKRIQGGNLDAASATQVLTAAQNLAVSSSSDLGTTTKAITDLLLVYHEKASDAASISDTLFQAHAQLGMGVDRLAMMLQRLQPRIAGSGVDMQHLLGIVRELAPAVGSGQRAIMMVGGVLQTLQNPSKAAESAFKALGVNIRDAQGNFIGFAPAVEAIRQAWLKLPSSVSGSADAMRLAGDQSRYSALNAEVQTKSVKAQEAALKSEITTLSAHGAALTQSTFLQAIWGRQSNIATALVQGGAAGIDANTKALQENGLAADATAIRMGDAQHQLAMIPKTIHDIQDSIGMELIPALVHILAPIESTLIDIARWVDENPKLAAGILAVVGGIGALVGMIAFAKPILYSLGHDIIEGLLLNPIGLTIIAVAGLVVGLSQIPGVAAPLAHLFSAIAAAITTIVGPFRAFVTSVLDFASGRGTFDAVRSSFESLETTVENAVPAIQTALGDVVAAVARAIPGMIDAISAALPQVAAVLGSIATAIGNWVMTVGLPALLGVLNTLIDGISAWIQSGGVQKIAAAVATWVSAFVSWAAPAVIGLIAALGAELVAHGPEIVNAALSAGEQLIVGIGQGIAAHPEAVAEAIVALFLTSIVVKAIATAVGLFQAAWTAAMKAIGLFTSALMDALFGPFKLGASAAGAEAGSGAAAAMRGPLVAGAAADGVAADEALAGTMVPGAEAAGAEAGAAAGTGLLGRLKGSLGMVKGLVGLAIGAAGSGVLSGGIAQGGTMGAAVGAGGGALMAGGGLLAAGPVGAAIGAAIALFQTQQQESSQSSAMAADVKKSADAMIASGPSIDQMKASLNATNLGIAQLDNLGPLGLLVQGDARDKLVTIRDNLQNQIANDQIAANYASRDSDKLNNLVAVLPTDISAAQAGNEARANAMRAAAMTSAATNAGRLIAQGGISIAELVRQSELAAAQLGVGNGLRLDFRAAEAAAHAAGATQAAKLDALTRAANDIWKGVGSLANRSETLAELKALRAEAAKAHDAATVAKLDHLIGEVTTKVENSALVNAQLAKAQKILDSSETMRLKVNDLTDIQNTLLQHGDTVAAGIISKAIGEVRKGVADVHTAVGEVRAAIQSARVAISVSVGGASQGPVSQVKVQRYQTGTDFVPTTGLAMLHAGEMVVPTDVAEVLRMMGGLEALTSAAHYAAAPAGYTAPPLGGSANYSAPSAYTPPAADARRITAENAVHSAQTALARAIATQAADRAKLVEDERRHKSHAVILAAEKRLATATHTVAADRERLHAAQATLARTPGGAPMGAGAFTLPEQIKNVGHGIYDLLSEIPKPTTHHHKAPSVHHHAAASTHHHRAASVHHHHGASTHHIASATVNIAGLTARARAAMTAAGVGPSLGASASTPVYVAQVGGGYGMRAYHTGVSFVPETGPALLQRGEAVLDVAAAARLRGGVGPGGTGAPGQGRSIVVNVYLNGRKVGEAVSRVLFEEERLYSGAAGTGSPF